MKKLLAMILCLITLSSLAGETVVIVYSWTASDLATNYDRSIVEEANKMQDKYTFIFDTRPGAGGSVAANHVLTTKNTILSTSSPFFIRPVLYPTESYDISKFQELMTQCSAPIVISSVKYKSWKDVPQDQVITIGVSGLGTTTHLVATQLALKYPNLQVIPFKSTSEAVFATVTKNTDFTAGFISDTKSWTAQNKSLVTINVLGITGTTPVAGYSTLVSEGFSPALGTMVPPYHLVVPKSIGDDKISEWRKILEQAAKATSVQESYKPDHCQPLNIPESELQTWFDQQTTKWNKLGQGIKLQ